MQVETLTVNLAERSYPIHIGSGLLGNGAWLRAQIGAGPVAIVSNETVAPLYLPQVQAALSDRVRAIKLLPDGEQYKNLDALSSVYDALLEAGCDRQCVVLALGGGVVGDIAGFAAATFQRGVAFVQVPTTLLAQVDSSVGGKTGVNHARGKNMIGAFHQPRCVISDIDTLSSLPERELAAGLAEVIKYGLIVDRDMHEWLCRAMPLLLRRDASTLIESIRRSCQCKARIVALDEREAGLRAVLNFGHTFGHAIETATDYAEFLHGEAVAIGMVMAARMSLRLGLIDANDCAAIENLLRSAGLPVAVSRPMDPNHFKALMAGDKKSLGGKPRLVLLRAIGEAFLSGDYDPCVLDALLAEELRVTERVSA
jgi:3-dehydroquinate synthase